MSSKRKSMNKQGIHPKLRFPEFQDAGDWQRVLLIEVLDYERPEKFIVANTNYKSSGVPVLTANKSFIRGYTDETNGVYENVPVIIFDDFTTDKKYVDFPFKVKSSVIKILKTKNKNNLKFVFELMDQLPFDAKDHKRYYISEYQNLSILLPNPEEQQKIADCLTSIDDLITAQSRKFNVLKNYKKGLMQQLFPAEGETVPKLRFSEFRDAKSWKFKPLDKVCNINPLRTGLPELFIYIDLESVSDGKLIAKKRINREDAPSRAQRLLKAEDVIFQIVRPYQRNNLFCDFDNESYYVASTGYAQLRALECSRFLYQAVHSDDFVNKVMAKCTGSNYPAINTSDLAKVSLAIPKDDEQQKIDNCLTSIDELITAQSQKLDALKNYKKGLMQQLFPSMSGIQA